MKLFTFSVFTSILFIFSNTSLNATADLNCTVNIPSLSVNNGCCELSDVPSSNFGNVEFMWAINTGSIQALTAWSTNQETTFCPSEAGYYRICTRVIGCSSIYESEDVYCEPNTCGTLEGIYIYNQDTDEAAYGPIQNNDQINESDLPSEYYLVAQTSGNIESVSYWVDGYTATENVEHYTFPNGAEDGNNWNGGVGIHNIDVNAYNQNNGNGEHCGQIWLSFEVLAQCQNVNDGGTIEALEEICLGESMTISNLESPSGGQGDLEFIWLFNPNEPSWSSASSIFSNTSSLTVYPTESGYYRRCARRNACNSYDGESNWIHILVIENCEETCNLSLEIEGPTETCGEDIELSANVSGSSTCFEACEYVVSAPDRCSDNEDFVFYIQNAPGGTKFYSSNASFIEFSDGTASFSANASNGTDNLEININYSEKTDISPIDSPKSNICEDTHTEAWTYYQSTSGTVLSENHGLFNVSRKGPSFQLGNTAMHIAPGFGASGWIYLNGGDGTYTDGDVNIALNPNCEETESNNDITYLWSTGGTESSITVNSPGTYSLTIVDCNGCIASSEYEISGCTEIPVGTSMENYIIECGDDLPNEAPSFSSSCDDDLDITFEETYNDLACGHEIIRTWFATDDCGNSSEVIQQILTIVDNTNPVFTETPADIQIASINELPDPGVVNATDNCGMVIMEFFETTPNSLCDGSIYRTWTAIDECGNSIEYTQQITLFDDEAPFATFIPEDLTLTCQDYELIEPQFDDNCDIDLDITLNQTSEEINGNTILTNVWTATDNNQNSTSATQIITLLEIGGPVLIGVPADTTVECTQVPSSPIVIAQHTCEEIEVEFSEEITEGCDYTITRTWTAEDSQGSIVSESQIISVVDTTPPTFNYLPNDTTISCGNIFSAPNLIAFDNCDDTLTVVLSQFGYNGTDCSGTLTRIYTVSDDCGNEASHTQIVTVVDDSAPIAFNAPEDIFVSCDESIPFDTVLFSDNCDDDISIAFSENSEIQNNFLLITRSWEAIDDCGNSTEISQLITVVQNEEIEFINVPADTTVECDSVPSVPTVSTVSNAEVLFSEEIEGDCPYFIHRTWTAISTCGNNYTASQIITVIDNNPPVFIEAPENLTVSCGEVPPAGSVELFDHCDTDIMLTVSQFGYNGTDCSGTLTRVYTATDNCGNQAQHTQIITIEDNLAPIAFNVPEDIDLECGEELPVSAPYFEDNCDEELTVVYNVIEEINGNTTIYVRTWTATDACSNETSVEQIVTISGTAFFLENIPSDTVVNCNAVPNAATVTASDGSSVYFNESVTGECPIFITRTWSATNNCGNAISGNQIITVIDDVSPQFLTLPDDITVNCGQIPAPIFPEVQDNCDENVEISYSQYGYNGTDCSGTLQRKFTATDNCGNNIEHIQLITIIDIEAPTFSITLSNITVECNEIPSIPLIEAFDNCGEVNIDYLEEIQGECPQIILRSWIATDLCGNSSTMNQEITVLDTLAPTFLNIPENLQVDCIDNIPDVEDVSAIDNCDSELYIEFEETESDNQILRSWSVTDNCGNSASDIQIITIIDNGAPTLIGVPDDVIVECDSIPEVAAVSAIDGCTSTDVIFEEQITDGCPFEIFRTWIAIDENGNTTMATQTISVVDIVAPILADVPEDLTTSCDSIPAIEMPTAVDNCDSNVLIEFEEISDYSSCPYTITRTWTAIDHCGNTDTQSQVITIIDNDAPTLINFESAIEVQCDETDGIFIEAEDNCGEAIISIVQDQLFSGACYGTIERTYLIEDGCGNSITIVQFLFLNDDEDPVFVETPETEITIECGDEIPPIVFPTATDNCDNDVEIEVSIHESNDGICPYVITRVFIANDDCGNDQKFVQIINVNPGIIGENDDPYISISPNPVQDKAKVQFALPHDGQAKINVTNIVGQERQLIYDNLSMAGVQNEIELQTEGWLAGIYFVNLFSEGKLISKKIVKN